MDIFGCLLLPQNAQDAHLQTVACGPKKISTRSRLVHVAPNEGAHTSHECLTSRSLHHRTAPIARISLFVFLHSRREDPHISHSVPGLCSNRAPRDACQAAGANRASTFLPDHPSPLGIRGIAILRYHTTLGPSPSFLCVPVPKQRRTLPIFNIFNIFNWWRSSSKPSLAIPSPAAYLLHPAALLPCHRVPCSVPIQVPIIEQHLGLQHEEYREDGWCQTNCRCLMKEHQHDAESPGIPFPSAPFGLQLCSYIIAMPRPMLIPLQSLRLCNTRSLGIVLRVSFPSRMHPSYGCPPPIRHRAGWCNPHEPPVVQPSTLTDGQDVFLAHKSGWPRLNDSETG